MVKQATRKRANGSTYKVWVVDSWVEMPTGERIRIRKDVPKGKASNRAEALAWAHWYVDSLSAKETKSLTAPRLRDYWDVYERQHCQLNNRKGSTKSKKSRFMNALVPVLGKKRLGDITRKDVEELKAEMLQRKAHVTTVNLTLALLRGMLNHAKDGGLINAVPPIRMLPSGGSAPPKHLSKEELADVLEAIEDDVVLKTVVLICADAGLRIGEARALLWSDVDDGHITVSKSMDPDDEVGPTKASNWRRLKMTDRLSSHLRRLRKTSKSKHVVGDDRYHAMKHRMAAVMEGLNLHHKGVFHCLRHTFATRLVRENVNLRVIKDLCGHSSIETTLRYASVSADVMADAIGRL